MGTRHTAEYFILHIASAMIYGTLLYSRRNLQPYTRTYSYLTHIVQIISSLYVCTKQDYNMGVNHHGLAQ